VRRLPQRAREAVAELAERQRETAALSRSAVQTLADAGLNGAEIAAVLKVSPQRISQLASTPDQRTNDIEAKRTDRRKKSASPRVRTT
jgi:uncharacterized protein YjiS (DUF1127 family)